MACNRDIFTYLMNEDNNNKDWRKYAHTIYLRKLAYVSLRFFFPFRSMSILAMLGTWSPSTAHLQNYLKKKLQN
jgi:hypothetical protein